MKSLRILLLLALAILPFAAAACGGDDDDEEPTPTAAATGGATAAAASPTATPKPSGKIVVYSGRGESLVKPLFEQFTRDTGIEVDVKYGDSAQLAALLVEEGAASPADVFFPQDAGALGAVAKAGLFQELPSETLAKVPATYRAKNGQWVGVSGRARVIVYNPSVPQADLPNSVKDLVDPKWKGKVGWAPTNGSFQSFVTALRKLEGEAGAEKWLRDMIANDVKVYKDNRAIVSAVAAGEIQLGLVNHYYLWGFIRDQGEGFAARNHYTAPGDAGSLVNVAGVGLLKTSKNRPAAQAFIDYLLSPAGQEYFVKQTYEYPLVDGMAADPRLPALATLKPPAIDLSDLDDLQGTLALLRKVGALQ
jgi:iron(III) transport system substrate-binding protein